MRRAFLFLPVFLLLAANAAVAETLHLRLLETSDIHVYLLPYDYYRDHEDEGVGLAKIATLVKEARREAPNTVLLDDGDLIQGNPMGDWAAANPETVGARHPVFKAMALMGYDAATIGNHEFNFGLEALDRTLKGAPFPYVLANVFDAKTHEPRWPPYVILERRMRSDDGNMATIRIGIIGAAPPQIMVWDHAKLDGKVEVKPIAATIERLIPEIRAKGADIVVALVHSGLSATEPRDEAENAGAYVARLPGIDAVLSGHQHRVFPGPTYKQIPDADLEKGTIGGTPVVMPGFWGSHLGIVDLTLERGTEGWHRIDGRASARPIQKREGKETVSLAKTDQEVAAAAADAHAHTLDYIRRPVGRIDRPVESYFALVADDPGVAVIARVQREAVARALAGTRYAALPLLSAASPFRAGGQPGPENYTRIPAGPVAIRNIADLYPYPNTLYAVVITGAGLREWLERAAGVFKRIDPAAGGRQRLIDETVPAYNFDIVTGVTYAIDLTRPPRYGRDGEVAAPDAHRIVDLRFEGRPVDPQARFVVATNSYRASGGGNFPGLAKAEIAYQSPESIQEIITGQFLAEGAVDPTPIPAWRFAPLGQPVEAVFTSAPAAAARLDGHPGIKALNENTAEGFGLFALALR